MSSDDRVQSWWLQALEDFDTGSLLSVSKFGAAAFFFQQSAEKALKAAAMARHLTPWGHSTLALFRALNPSAEPSLPLYRDCQRLDFFYIPTRYPDAFPEGTASEHFRLDDAMEAQQCAQRILDWVQSLLNE